MDTRRTASRSLSIAFLAIAVVLAACSASTSPQPLESTAITPAVSYSPAVTPSPSVTPTTLPITDETTPVPSSGASPVTTPAGTPPSQPKPPSPPTRPSLPTPTSLAQALPPLDAFMKGIYFNDWKSFDATQPGLYPPSKADQSLKNLTATGANWIGVYVGVGQETISSTKIFRSPPQTATDAELRHVIELAHSLGIRVMLAPGIRLSKDPDHWWGQIGTAFTSETQWQEWFASYREIMNYYATFSQETGVDMLLLGDELGGVTHREADWRWLIQEVRQRFKGLISYDSLGEGRFPHGETERIKWWDAVDYIGVHGYLSLTQSNNPTVGDLKSAWLKNGYLTRLESLSQKWQKPILMTEIGYRSVDGTNKNPANSETQLPIDLQEQADCYEAAMEVLWGKPWLKGVFWWQWSALSLGGPNDDRFWPFGKPAEEVLRKFYLEK